MLVLDGIEKAERNVLPVLNNLLENREMQLEDGRFIVAPQRYDKLLTVGSTWRVRWGGGDDWVMKWGRGYEKEIHVCSYSRLLKFICLALQCSVGDHVAVNAGRKHTRTCMRTILYVQSCCVYTSVGPWTFSPGI